MNTNNIQKITVLSFLLLTLNHVNLRAADDSEFISISAPTSISPEQSFDTEVTFLNVGTSTWSESNGHRLRTQNPQGNDTWGFKQVRLPSDEKVKPGESYTFLIKCTAPIDAGAYNLQFRMMKRKSGSFGERSKNKEIIVTAKDSRISSWKNYKLHQLPIIRDNVYQDIEFNESQPETTELLVLSASHGNPKDDTRNKESKTSGGSWKKIAYAGNDDKSLEIWMRDVTSANKNNHGSINTKNAKAKLSIIVYDGKVKIGSVVGKKLHNEAVAINGRGTAPFLVAVATDNGGDSSEAEEVYGTKDDKTFIYLTNDRTFKDSSAGKRRGAIACIELKEG